MRVTSGICGEVASRVGQSQFVPSGDQAQQIERPHRPDIFVFMCIRISYHYAQCLASYDTHHDFSY